MPPEPWPRYPRSLPGAWSAIDDLQERMDGMQLADEIAALVKVELDRQRRVTFSVAQRLLGGVVGGVAVASFVLNLLRSTGNL